MPEHEQTDITDIKLSNSLEEAYAKTLNTYVFLHAWKSDG